jgi:hypothetical protein
MAGAPLAVGALWLWRRALLLAMAPVLLYWLLITPVDDLAAMAGDPAASASYYRPLRAELVRLSAGRPVRVEVPLTGAHFEAAYLPGGAISLARGWERQLDVRYGAIFYGGPLSAAVYRAWLSENAVAYVALPDARLDWAGTAEGHLIERGVPYLHEVWRSAHWRLYAVTGATPLAQPPARLLSLTSDSFTLKVPGAGAWKVRVRYTRYWSVVAGRACVRDGGGWTVVNARAAGVVRAQASFSIARMLGAAGCA